MTFWLELLIMALLGVAFGRLYFIIESKTDNHKTAFFFKQWGGKNKKNAGRLYRGRLWNNFPKIAAQEGKLK